MECLKADGYDFSVGIPIDTPITEAERVVSAGKGIGSKENMQLIEIPQVNQKKHGRDIRGKKHFTYH